MIKFTIHSRLPSLNEVNNDNRANKYKGAKLKKDTEALIIAEIKKQKVQPVTEYPVEVFIRWVEPNRKRDVDNIQSSKKFILDAMVRAGVLANDSQRYVAQVYDHVECADKAMVEVNVKRNED
ncbi:MAG: hypothetical protein IKH14_07040 [Prevotella sp.]|nr:hypothetical protein [Prevotella sp.]